MEVASRNDEIVGTILVVARYRSKAENRCSKQLKR